MFLTKADVWYSLIKIDCCQLWYWRICSSDRPNRICVRWHVRWERITQKMGKMSKSELCIWIAWMTVVCVFLLGVQSSVAYNLVKQTMGITTVSWESGMHGSDDSSSWWWCGKKQISEWGSRRVEKSRNTRTCQTIWMCSGFIVGFRLIHFHVRPRLSRAPTLSLSSVHRESPAQPDISIKAIKQRDSTNTTFLSFLVFWHLKKKEKSPPHWPFLSLPISFSLLFPLTHSSLYFSYSAVLFARRPCLPSPHPSLPPTRLLIHPLGEQCRGELTTAITTAISYWETECGTNRKLEKKHVQYMDDGSHYECISHMLPK